MEDFEVDITLGLTENNYITGGMGYAGTMVEQEKAKLTFADFIGTSDGKADGNGFHMAYTNGSVEDFASIFAAQYEAMKASGALGEDNNLTQQEFLEQFYRQGEFTHDSSNPFLNFVSSVLDITIIKPVIEACTGEDLITGEDLTDIERGLKVVFAVVDLVTLGGAIAATKFSEMGLKEGLKAFGKTALIDFAGNTAACGVGALGETFDWPVPITMMLSLAAGITVSISGNKLLFKNADGIEIGSKTLSDDDLKIVEQTIEGENYSNLTEVVSAKEAEVYLHFLESGSTEGMTESELKAVQKIEELIKSNKIDYDGILKIRNETVKSDVEVVRKTTEDSVEDVGKNAAEDAGKVVESGTSSELKVIGTYDNNNYFTRAVEFNAGSEGTGFTYKVYQRNDIDWNIVRTTGAKKGRGLTNAQAAEKYGLAPILNDGYVATLHHSQQRSVGPLFEASTRYHNISNAKKGPLHPYKGQLNPFNPMDSNTRGLFQKVDSIEYWKARGRDAMKGVQ